MTHVMPVLRGTWVGTWSSPYLWQQSGRGGASGNYSDRMTLAELEVCPVTCVTFLETPTGTLLDQYKSFNVRL